MIAEIRQINVSNVSQANVCESSARWRECIAALRLSVRGAGRRPLQAATARELELSAQSLSCRYGYGYKLPGGCLCGAGCSTGSRRCKMRRWAGGDLVSAPCTSLQASTSPPSSRVIAPNFRKNYTILHMVMMLAKLAK